MDYSLRLIFLIIIIIILIINLSKKSKARATLKEELKKLSEKFEVKEKHIAYTSRHFIFLKEYTYSLDDYGITRSSEKGINMRIGYDEIDSINIAPYLIGPYWNIEKAFRCAIKSKKKGKIVFVSTTAPAWAEVKAQTIDFCRFVMVLHKKLENRFDKIRFTKRTSVQVKQTFYLLYFCGLFLFFVAEAAARRFSVNRAILGILAIGAIATLLATPFLFMTRPKIYSPQKGEYPYDINKIAALQPKV